jgi:queuine tRNA-ribosyltransferase
VLLSDGSWRSKHLPLGWDLVEGDFLARLGEAGVPLPDLIFFDPFSYKTDQDMWTHGAFERVFARCGAHDVELFTYTASTRIRAALLAAGFFVARGLGTGAKEETTMALTPRAIMRRQAEGGLDALLGDEWLSRWERSDAKFPPTLTPDHEPRFATLIRGHQQFGR